uniref:NAD(P)(+)--arginine ADP-ribosyltransferase n=1 Tax=Cyanoderma ruficeps TaxID=181631 RepID=A0A8C3QN45_9PASS
MASLAHTLALLAMTMATGAMKVVPLHMALDSFDDQYQGCGRKMTEALPALNRSEFQQNPLFAQGWAKAAAEWREKGSPVYPLSSPDQAIAIMAYTRDDLYQEFNAAVRVAGSSPQEYWDNFHFKTLHFLLTQALRTLRDTQGPQCHNVFRGLDEVQFKAKSGDTVRFGQFASTSLRETSARKFGTDTVFQVHTCLGAAIRGFSVYPGEKEVLIPPFETFKVTQVTHKENKVQIQLRSTGNYSKYNCEWLKGDTTDALHGPPGGSITMAPFHLGGLLATTALAVATGTL